MQAETVTQARSAPAPSIPPQDLLRVIDLEAFIKTPLESEPYEHIVVPNFIRAGAVAAALRDFPAVSGAGSYPLDKMVAGPGFKSLIDEFKSTAVREAFSDKFGLNLSPYPLMATVRGQMQARDGRIHTDTASKIITVLIYMNAEWPHEGGRLRILRDGHNLENYAAEVAPLAGTLLAFKRSAHSWHGHLPFVGLRRSIQLNWVTSEDFIDDQYNRHSISAIIKGARRFFSGRRED